MLTNTASTRICLFLHGRTPGKGFHSNSMKFPEKLKHHQEEIDNGHKNIFHNAKYINSTLGYKEYTMITFEIYSPANPIRIVQQNVLIKYWIVLEENDWICCPNW